MSQRFKLLIEYDGTPFCGWQSQKTGGAVQDALARAVVQFCGEKINIFGAGRTDSGVHAYGQVAHITLTKPTDSTIIQKALNQHLKPLPIAILAVEKVADDFDARFSAVKRHYLYRIITRQAPLVLEANRAWHVPVGLDARAMHDAGQVFIGKHDFTTFRSVKCQAASAEKTIDSLTVTQAGEVIEIRVAARSFLHHQVRSFVGALKIIGEGKWQIEDMKAALAARDRTACPPLAPACGLYLVKVDYL
ncbi:MAG: tRNA pseudouridine(38-40) synthase TruA [Alphaproteobacteria bacterium]|nr:tRNA pseudouridine(38-40) synthase TruA [Alphaproteobacteria bacterium]